MSTIIIWYYILALSPGGFSQASSSYCQGNQINSANSLPTLVHSPVLDTKPRHSFLKILRFLMFIQVETDCCHHRLPHSVSNETTLPIGRRQCLRCQLKLFFFYWHLKPGKQRNLSAAAQRNSCIFFLNRSVHMAIKKSGSSFKAPLKASTANCNWSSWNTFHPWTFTGSNRPQIFPVRKLRKIRLD